MEPFIEKVAKAKQLIEDGVEKFPSITVASSFGKDSMVLLHLVRQVKPAIPVFTVFMDTEFPETIEFSRRIAREWNLNYRELFAYQGKDVSIEDCCGKAKVEKHKEILQDFDAWFSGIRKTEGITRANFEYVEEKGSLTKINPILDFTELNVWRYIAINGIPANPKYDEGYRSLGCAICIVSEETVPEKSEQLPEWQGRQIPTVGRVIPALRLYLTKAGNGTSAHHR